jgi:hypothetical protein
MNVRRKPNLRILSLLCGGILLLTTTAASAQSAFLNKDQSGLAIAGGVSPENEIGVTSYTVSLGASTKRRSDAWVSASRASGPYNTTAYSVGMGYTPYFADDRGGRTMALGGIPLALNAIFPPSGRRDNTIIGSAGLELDIPLYWGPDSRLLLRGEGNLNYQLAPEVPDRSLITFTVGVEQAFRLSPKAMLLLGFGVGSDEHTDYATYLFELGMIFPD